jgi:hypothetical protein
VLARFGAQHPAVPAVLEHPAHQARGRPLRFGPVRNTCSRASASHSAPPVGAHVREEDRMSEVRTIGCTSE